MPQSSWSDVAAAALQYGVKSVFSNRGTRWVSTKAYTGSHKFMARSDRAALIEQLERKAAKKARKA